jgi:glycosyltransferase-like protein
MIALVTYSTKPRGGVVHTLSLAEALHASGVQVCVVGLGDPEEGFFRPTTVPHIIIPAPLQAATLEERVFESVDTLAAGLARLSDGFSIFHTQDCISARAACRVRDAGAGVAVLRTVHHVDDFTTQALIDCQRQAILEPDKVLVVSEYWRQTLAADYRVDAEVVHNGVDAQRFGPISQQRRLELRRQVDGGGRFVFLAVGGIEPRKGSVYLLEAMAMLKRRGRDRAVLVVIGGHSFQDYQAYRDAALARLPDLGLELGVDVVVLGTVTDLDLAGWYRAADALAFPSVKEGWGLAVLEAMSAGLPVIASDIPVFREYLTAGESALLVPPQDSPALADTMQSLMVDSDLRSRLGHQGRVVAGRFTWPGCARQHSRIYGEVLAARERHVAVAGSPRSIRG